MVGALRRRILTTSPPGGTEHDAAPADRGRARPAQYALGRDPDARALADGEARSSHRPLRADREQHHLRRLRRRDEVLGLLPHRRCGLGLHPGVGLRRRWSSRAPRAWRWASASMATGRWAATWWCSRRASTQRGFVDGAAHRRALPAVYNHSSAAPPIPATAPSARPQQALLRPLFTTSFLIDDFLADDGVLRRAAGAAVQRVEQDRLRHGLLPGAAPRPAGCAAHRRPDLGRQPRLLRDRWAATTRCAPTTSWRSWTAACRRCTSTSPAMPACAGRSTSLRRRR